MYIGKKFFNDSQDKKIPDDPSNIMDESFYLVVPSFFFEKPSNSSKKKNKARFSNDEVNRFKNCICVNDTTF